MECELLGLASYSGLIHPTFVKPLVCMHTSASLDVWVKRDLSVVIGTVECYSILCSFADVPKVLKGWPSRSPYDPLVRDLP
uniref:Uncharacterized protein n=1 Tax=Daphnia galeata TaxID=27404 RepID=A0A8J2RWM5_9CRUS|nr:unnamed protein product [Daphnia galeata]